MTAIHTPPVQRMVSPCVRVSIETIRDRAFWADSADLDLLWKLCDQMEKRNQRTLRKCTVREDVADALKRVFRPDCKATRQQ